jgi:hypothetical protein
LMMDKARQDMAHSGERHPLEMQRMQGEIGAQPTSELRQELETERLQDLRHHNWKTPGSRVPPAGSNHP